MSLFSAGLKALYEATKRKKSVTLGVVGIFNAIVGNTLLAFDCVDQKKSPARFTQPFHHLQVSTGGKPIYYVSAKRDVFTPMKLPKYTLPKVT